MLGLKRGRVVSARPICPKWIMEMFPGMTEDILTPHPRGVCVCVCVCVCLCVCVCVSVCLREREGHGGESMPAVHSVEIPQTHAKPPFLTTLYLTAHLHV